jgi:hypothetical protein
MVLQTLSVVNVFIGITESYLVSTEETIDSQERDVYFERGSVLECLLQIVFLFKSCSHEM